MCSKGCRALSLQGEVQETPSSCGKACGIENNVRNDRVQREHSRFGERPRVAFKRMNDNQLGNSSGINTRAAAGTGI